jgi:hypothetical protein
MKTIDYPKTVADPVITEVRRHKQEIAEVFGLDVMALGRSLQLREVGDSRFKTPATRSGANSEAGDKPQSDAEGRSQ